MAFLPFVHCLSVGRRRHSKDALPLSLLVLGCVIGGQRDSRSSASDHARLSRRPQKALLSGPCASMSGVAVILLFVCHCRHARGPIGARTPPAEAPSRPLRVRPPRSGSGWLSIRRYAQNRRRPVVSSAYLAQRDDGVLVRCRGSMVSGEPDREFFARTMARRA